MAPMGSASHGGAGAASAACGAWAQKSPANTWTRSFKFGGGVGAGYGYGYIAIYSALGAASTTQFQRSLRCRSLGSVISMKYKKRSKSSS